MTDIESFKRQTGVKVDYRQFDMDELAPAPILQPPPATPEPPPKAEFKPPAPPGPAAPAAPSAGAFSRYAASQPSQGVLLSELFKRLDRQ